MRTRNRVSARQVAVGLTGCAAGFLFVISAVAARGVDLRASGTQTLPDLAATNVAHYRGLVAQRQALARQVDALAQQRVGSPSRLTRRVAAARALAGVEPVSGPGVTVTLTDASASRMDQAGVDPSELLVHQQDIQAVVNAMWAAHATGVTVQGQRVVSTTGIKCVGNTVVLQGIPYAPPYVITAVGAPAEIYTSLDHDQWIGYYLALVPKGLGWQVTERTHVTLPPYRGSTDLLYARPLKVGPGQ